jgi:hypothetical protein
MRGKFYDIDTRSADLCIPQDEILEVFTRVRYPLRERILHTAAARREPSCHGQ